jgi:hypothetical protein
MKTTIEEDFIIRYYRPAQRETEKRVFLTATDITLRLEDFTKKITLRNVGVALKKLGFERVYHTLNGVKTKGYFVVQLIGSI